MEPRDFERWLAEGEAPERGAGAAPRAEGALRAPEGFTDRVMARVLETEAPVLAHPTAEPRRIPAWMTLASDPLTAVGVTLMLVLAGFASWYPGHLLRGAVVASGWASERAASAGQGLDPTSRLALDFAGLLLAAFLVWRLWRAVERALVLSLSSRSRS